MDAHTSSSKTTGSAPSPHQAGMDAIDQVLARLELSPEGQILDANPHFLTIMGYPLDELKGKHHGMLLSPDEAQSATYDTLWETLRSGTSQESEFHLLDKQGRDIWIRGACSPVLDTEGQLTRIIVYAMDLTGQKQLTASFEGQLNALSRVMGKVEFSLDGTILDANPRFLDIVGYRLEELKGQHHRLLVDPDYAQSADYRTFWETLRRGEFLAGEFCRLGKQGQEVWIQGSYNPVLDLNGKPSKIVKFATDITAQVEQHRQLKRGHGGSGRGRQSSRGAAQVAAGDVYSCHPYLGRDPAAAIGGDHRLNAHRRRDEQVAHQDRRNPGPGLRAGYCRCRYRGYRRRQPADQDHQGDPVHGL